MLSKIFQLKNFIWFCAIGLASFSGYYSVFGISKLFSGGSLSIVGMAAMLEFSKLVVVTFIHDHFKSLRLLFKSYLIGAAVVLMMITSIGVYGYLTNSYQETSKKINKTQNELNLLDNQKLIFETQKNQTDKLISDKTNRINSYDNIRISQENTYNTSIASKLNTRGLQKNIQSIDKSVTALNNEISSLNAKSLGLSDSITAVEQKKLISANETLNSELGPLLYLSKVTGLQMDTVVNWFILILVVVFDPLAVSLVIAANYLKNKKYPDLSNNITIEDNIPLDDTHEEIKIKDNVTALEIDDEPQNLPETTNNLDATENISILNDSNFTEKQMFYNENTGKKRYTRGIST